MAGVWAKLIGSPAFGGRWPYDMGRLSAFDGVVLVSGSDMGEVVSAVLIVVATNRTLVGYWTYYKGLSSSPISSLRTLFWISASEFTRPVH